MAQRPEKEKIFEKLLVDQLRLNETFFIRLAYGILRDKFAARDMCQQALLKALERRATLEDASNLRSWLARVVVTESLQLHRRLKIERRILGRHAMAIAGDGHPAGEVERREAVIVALEQLPEDVRTIVVLRVIQGMPGKEVKELLQCSSTEASRQMHRGFELLRGILGDDWGVGMPIK